jgi:hypothetical protein
VTNILGKAGSDLSRWVDSVGTLTVDGFGKRSGMVEWSQE